MSFTLRTALPGDLAALTGIYRESVLNGVASYELEPPSAEEMHARFEAITGKGYPYIVAVEETGHVCGFAYASAFRTRPAYRWLVEDSIYLAPDARGRGIGKALLAGLILRCTALGFRQMVAVIGGADPASIGLHRAAGFTHSGQMEATGFKHGRWLDTVLMQRALGEGAATEPPLDAFPGTMTP
jgi:L-amino acid N-acyltransferase YncA